jgi:hypothetical protein
MAVKQPVPPPFSTPSPPPKVEHRRTTSSSKARSNVSLLIVVLCPQISRFTHNSIQPVVESAVTRLLVSIKQLLEGLTQWANSNSSEEDVSDVYVRLGNDFNAAVAAFGFYEIDMSYVLWSCIIHSYFYVATQRTPDFPRRPPRSSRRLPFRRSLSTYP